VGGLKASALLQTRVGIATGLVIVGDLIGSGEAQERGIVGETPNLAARLQGLAEPNTVVIAASTRKLLGDLFELEDLGARDLKGIAAPVRAWTALRPSRVESRFEALHARSHMTPLANLRLGGALLRSGVGLFALGLTAGLGLILHYFYVTPFEICSASFATMTPTESGPGRCRCSPRKDLRWRLPRWGFVSSRMHARSVRSVMLTREGTRYDAS
jgi:hypothetical protein